MSAAVELCHLAAMRTFAIAAVLLVAAVAAAERQADPLWVILQAKDRTEDDRKQDEARKPLETLRFMEVKPGMKVADLGAGGGYLTELLARAVGPTGKVWAQNSKEVVEKYLGTKWDERLARPVNKNVVKAERPSDDPLPPDAKDLDLVVNGFTYHDLTYMPVDRDKMNKAIFAALKPGGHYVIMDHAGRPGTGATEAKTLHRIEEKVVIDEVKKAGFEVEKEGDFLKNPADPKDASVFGPLRGKTDRFIVSFVKPKK
jgi:predicted methyltransferase